MTKKRKQILAVLQQQKQALSATDVSRLLPEVDLVTIYRNLARFCEEKLIKRVMLDTGEARFEYQKTPHHHAICTDCERVIHFTAPDKKIISLLQLKGFHVSELDVTVKGICRHQ